ncbi:polysaccharide biosynthesis/export family protein, partial [Psychrobacter sp. A3]
MNTKPRAIVMMISVAMAAMSMSANAVSYAEQMAGSSFGTSANNASQDQNRNNINVSTQAFAGGVPGQATTQEAVNAASLPSQSVINTTRPYQDINTQDMMFGEQLFRGAFSTTSGSTFNDSYVINPGDNVQVRMWGAYQFASTMTVDPQGNIFLPNVGPVRIAGVQNGNLQNVVKSAVNRIYRSNVGV